MEYSKGFECFAFCFLCYMLKFSRVTIYRLKGLLYRYFIYYCDKKYLLNHQKWLAVKCIVSRLHINTKLKHPYAKRTMFREKKYCMYYYYYSILQYVHLQCVLLQLPILKQLLLLKVNMATPFQYSNKLYIYNLSIYCLFLYHLLLLLMFTCNFVTILWFSLFAPLFDISIGVQARIICTNAATCIVNTCYIVNHLLLIHVAAVYMVMYC